MKKQENLVGLACCSVGRGGAGRPLCACKHLLHQLRLSTNQIVFCFREASVSERPLCACKHLLHKHRLSTNQIVFREVGYIELNWSIFVSAIWISIYLAMPVLNFSLSFKFFEWWQIFGPALSHKWNLLYNQRSDRGKTDVQWTESIRYPDFDNINIS